MPMQELVNIQARAKKGVRVPFVWTENCEKAFLAVKEALTNAPLLSYPRQ